MKLVLIAIFSVILLVVCEPQQEVLADGDASGLYGSYGRNTRFDDEIDHDQRPDRNRNNESRGQERDSDREDYKDRNRNDDRSKENEKSTENDDDDLSDDKWDKKNYDEGFKNQRNDKKRDRNRKNDGVDGKDDKNRDKNEDIYQDKNSKIDYREENIRNQNKDSKQGNDRFNYNGNKNYERQNQYGKGSRGDNNERSYEQQGSDMGGKNNYGLNYDDKARNKNKDKDDQDKKYTENENYQQRDNKYYEYDRKNYNDDKNNKNKEKEYNKQDRGNNKYEYDRKYNYGSDSNNNNNNYDDQNRKKDKFRDEKNSRDTDYSKEYNKKDKGNNKYENNYGLNSNSQGQTNQDINRQLSYHDGQTRYDKQTRGNKENNDKYNYDSNENKEKDDYGRDSEYKEDGRDSKYKEKYQNSQNIERPKYGRSKSESRNYENEDKLTSNQYDNRYSYLESLITAPKQKDDDKVKAKERKGEVIEIHGYISKGNENNDKQVEVDVILKKADTASGRGDDSKGGIHVHKVLNNESKGYQVEKPQSEVTYEYIKPGKVQDNQEKDYKELFKNHVQDKKEFIGGMELLGIISNIGQEIKEQVIEKIPGYNIIHNLDSRRPKNEEKQYYGDNQEKKYPKIDLEVYSPFNQFAEKVKKVEKNGYQIDEKGKKVEEIKVYTESSKQDKEFDYTRNKSKKERISGKNYDQVNKSDGIGSKSKSNSDVSKGINANFKAKGNQELEVYQREGIKSIYDHTISNKQNVYNIVKNKAPQAKSQQEEYYNPGDLYQKGDRDPWIQRPGTTQSQVFNQQQNGRHLEPYIPRQNPVYDNRDNDYSAYLDRDINREYYQNPRYIGQPDRTNLQLNYNKQKDYVHEYSIGKQSPLKNYEAPYSVSPYKQSFLDYRPDNQYNEKNNYGTKANEGWSYQGYHIDKDRKEKEGENYPKYNKDQDNIRRGNEGYQGYRFRDPNNNKGYPDYTLPNTGSIAGYDIYQPQPYPLTDLMNPLSQQISQESGKLGY